MLAVRQNMGAHTEYAEFRAIAEILEHLGESMQIDTTTGSYALRSCCMAFPAMDGSTAIAERLETLREGTFPERKTEFSNGLLVPHGVVAERQSERVELIERVPPCYTWAVAP